MTAWVNCDPYTLIPERNSDGTRHWIRIRVNKAPDIERWALILSDGLQSYRSALDHAVYAIAAANHNPVPEDIARNSGFPICDTADRFTSAGHKINHVSVAVRGVIEQFQPYNRRTNAEAPPVLAILRDLNDADKHRLIHLLFTNTTEGELTNMRSVRGIHGEPYGLVANTGELVDGAELMAIRFANPQPDFTYDFNASIQVSVKHAPGPKGADRADPVGLLKAIDSEVRAVLDAIRHVV